MIHTRKNILRKNSAYIDFTNGEVPKHISKIARTLDPKVLGKNDSGWTIEGQIHEDYYTWVCQFTAIHPRYGRVQGSYETIITGYSTAGINHFMKSHPPHVWDYHDI